MDMNFDLISGVTNIKLYTNYLTSRTFQVYAYRYIFTYGKA